MPEAAEEALSRNSWERWSLRSCAIAQVRNYYREGEAGSMNSDSALRKGKGITSAVGFYAVGLNLPKKGPLLSPSAVIHAREMPGWAEPVGANVKRIKDVTGSRNPAEVSFA